MAEQLKAFFSPALVRRLAGDVTRVHPAFPDKAFIRQATKGLEDLELLDRGRHIARALEAHLPPRYPDAVQVLLESLGPEHASDELIGAGMAPFFYLPHTLFVATRGLGDFEVSMRAQYELTKRFSAESSIRPYIAAEPERTMAILRQWAGDGNAHVRRLVSEGTRLRLPWAMRVAWLDAHPERVKELLELLKDDPASLVRRSVANNLNDLGKVHPALLLRTCSAWLEGATPARRDLVEHALRSAVKRGEPGALRLLGYGSKAAVEITGVVITPKRATQELLVDLGVHFMKGSGKTARKVFKLKRITLQPGGAAELAKTI
ncbi:MAG: DNA alkylation repair protein, partial [Cytophagaceae bacterium]|nr:DNA alkylation repair protein [Gemmatimonadaceae bacterium]